jgi:hypothetical protein
VPVLADLLVRLQAAEGVGDELPHLRLPRQGTAHEPAFLAVLQ